MIPSGEVLVLNLLLEPTARQSSLLEGMSSVIDIAYADTDVPTFILLAVKPERG